MMMRGFVPFESKVSQVVECCMSNYRPDDLQTILLAIYGL